jgi:predicted porin
MQKKLIALAIASAISAPALADNANFTFYGKADLSYDFINTGNSAAGVSGTSKRDVSSNVSKFGFKGASDLGSGLSGIWQIEQQVDLNGGTTAGASGTIFATRNTYAGLKGDFGTVLMGKYDTPYKISTRSLDVFGDSIADNRALMGGVTGTSAAASFDGRQNNVLAYISPAFSGLTIAAATVNLKQDNTTSAQPNDNAFSIAAMYDAAPFYGSVAYESHTLNSNVTTTQGNSESAAKAGFGFTQDALNVGLVYEKTTDKLALNGANKFGHNAFYVAGKYTIGTGAVKAAYGKLGDVGGVADTGATQASLGYDYNLSKSTKLYAIYSRISNKTAAGYGFSQSTSGKYSVNGLGGTPSAISLGVQHNF